MANDQYEEVVKQYEGQGCGSSLIEPSISFDDHEDLNMSDVGDSFSQSWSPTVSYHSSISSSYCSDSDKKPKLQLPSFEELGITSSFTQSLEKWVRHEHIKPMCPDHQSAFERMPWVQSWPPRFTDIPMPSNNVFGALPLLTPPEDNESFKWGPDSDAEHTTSPYRVAADRDTGSRLVPQTHGRQASNVRPTAITLPEHETILSDPFNGSTGIEQAREQLVSKLIESRNTTQVQMVVQTLPAQSKAIAHRSMWENVVEMIQSRISPLPYITITHAISQVCTMDEVPTSPPATPNTHNGEGYFEDQTIFTHAAVVPTYHDPGRQHSSSNSLTRPSNIIAAPSSINVSILERYIPPSSSEEVQDMFSLSRKSYLADRLVELSVANGTLLFLYPTKVGGSTFAHRYMGPVIEPFLRRFVMLNNLYTNVADQLGQMNAVPNMLDFDEMRRRVGEMLETLTRRPQSRGVPSTYKLVHASKAEIILDRTTWMEWFLEQEQGRLRQNLVDYHQSGGRMPSRQGHIEATPGLLAREVVDGIRNSREEAGNVGIEIGVFVIRRSLV